MQISTLTVENVVNGQRQECSSSPEPNEQTRSEWCGNCPVFHALESSMTKTINGKKKITITLYDPQRAKTKSDETQQKECI